MRPPRAVTRSTENFRKRSDEAPRGPLQRQEVVGPPAEEAAGDRVVRVSTGPGEEIVRRLDSDHSFYLVEEGSFEVELDGSVVRVLGPGEHFGELAARDWGAGYGYVRLATVRSVGPGRLFQLTSDDFAWLCDESPGFSSAMAEASAERLRRR